MFQLRTISKHTLRLLTQTNKQSVVMNLNRAFASKFDPPGYDTFAQEDRAKAQELKQQQQNNQNVESQGNDEMEEDVVPEVFRAHRHTYSEKPKEIEGYKRQLYYRCSHIGTKELEIILGDWLKLNMHNMSYADLEEFDNNILDIENPQLQRYFVNGEPIKDFHLNNKYVKIVQDYVERRKTDYINNIPKPEIF
ncbi:UNKNOWN [Stylonychia lemnae]|uniref:Uncharacterized protein n=1 Tax=Stylonychia lemnae TaxID=5949 RepID=A0A078AZR2_STYLE|nr:UNKNOWN [Stylonychia lemnae]|eukprot:CDW86288.1 UNKNOWN [Stylonychia lemnae]